MGVSHKSSAIKASRKLSICVKSLLRCGDISAPIICPRLLLLCIVHRGTYIWLLVHKILLTPTIVSISHLDILFNGLSTTTAQFYTLFPCQSNNNSKWLFWGFHTAHSLIHVFPVFSSFRGEKTFKNSVNISVSILTISLRR